MRATQKVLRIPAAGGISHGGAAVGLPSPAAVGLHCERASSAPFQNHFSEKNADTPKTEAANRVGSQPSENWRIKERVQTMVRLTSEAPGTNLVPQKILVPITERDAAQEFSAVIIPFTTWELAQAAKRSKEAAKAWKEGRSLPSAWSIMNMAREIPAVRNWMLAKLGADPQFSSPEMLHVLARAIQGVAAMPGPDGDRVRALLAGKAGEP